MTPYVKLYMDTQLHFFFLGILEFGGTYAGKKKQDIGFPKKGRKEVSKFVDVKIRVTAEDREQIQSHAIMMGESMASFIKRAISETMDRDRPKQSNPPAKPNFIKTSNNPDRPIGGLGYFYKRLKTTWKFVIKSSGSP